MKNVSEYLKTKPCKYAYRSKILKTINMVQVCCPVGVSEEITAVFYLEKSQLNTENDKSLNFPFFKVSTHFSSNFGDFVVWNVSRGQQGKRWLSSNQF